MMKDAPNHAGDASLSILVVDDDVLNQRMMLVILEREGHQVDCVGNGMEALEIIRRKSYDMILMDLQMPLMDGVETSRRIREWEGDGRHAFIVALTASYLPEKGRELYEAGIDNYISKPFEMDHLRNILEYGLENRRRGLGEGAGHPNVERLALSEEFDYQEGIRRVGGNRETYRELLDDFLQELPDKIKTFWTFYRNKDMDSLNRAAHNLKGVSANLGALQLSEYAGRLENQVSEGYNERVEGLLHDIGMMVGQLQENVQKYYAGQQMTTGKLK
jgi:CheY-like chemotaxis protein